MDFVSKLYEVQESLIQENISGWLFYDFRGSNPLAYTFLEIPSDRFFSRRFFYWIPQSGEPIKIVSAIESHAIDFLPGKKLVYRTWQDLEEVLFSLVKKHPIIAMEYSPDNSLPVISKVDAGTIELVRKAGAQIVSSANLLQKYTSVWTEKQFQYHLEAAKILDHIATITWDFIRKALQADQTIDEYIVQQFMLEEMHKNNCITDHPPICAVNANSANPHYNPIKETALVIKPDDFILIDLWCKKDLADAVYSDIARVGVVASNPNVKQQEIFQIVKAAREKATQFIRENYENHRPIQGWQVDQVCRDYINNSGYGEFFIHRTGHSIGEQVHGTGANLDNFETHDFRSLLAGTCFSVEPGIYIPDQFGVRLEYDVYLDPSGHVIITGGIQDQIVSLL